MAKRLRDDAVARLGTQGRTGWDVCRLCGGAIVVEDLRRGPAPQRKICRKCGTEYGTTARTDGSLYAAPAEYSVGGFGTKHPI
jgi:hypothetical protein